MEGPFYFSSNGKQLYGFLHRPNKNKEKKKAIILCSPHAEEYLNSHRLLYNFAIQFRDEGYDCLRFDYCGYGDSEGEFRDATIETMVNDILESVNLFDDNSYASICLLGIRLGATIATLAANQNEKIQRVIMINPIFDMQKYINDCLRANLAYQLVIHNKVVKNTKELLESVLAGEEVNFHGYEMTKNFVKEALGTKLNDSICKLNCKILNIKIMKGIKEINSNMKYINEKEIYYKEVPGIHYWLGSKNYKDKDDLIAQEILSWLE